MTSSGSPLLSPSTISSPVSSTRKRAHSPPPPLPELWSPSGPSKRRRPNLANGFSSLSITSHKQDIPSALPSYAESQAADLNKDVDEDDQTSPTLDDVSVEVLPDSSRRRPSGPRRRSFFVQESSTSDTASEGGDSSDTTFTPAFRGRAQQADSVEQPDGIAPYGDVAVEDVTDLKQRKRRGTEDPDAPGQKRRKEEMDVDMDDPPGEIFREPERGRVRTRAKTTWHEPEKDRIVITSLSSSSSRSSSAQSDSPRRQLSQPGQQGFTLSPSLLTHLLATQRSPFVHIPEHQEQRLVLYRPLDVPPGIRWNHVVHNWSGAPTVSLSEDSGRFEEVDNDESTGMGDGRAETGDLYDGGMEIEDGRDVGDTSMDMDMDA